MKDKTFDPELPGPSIPRPWYQVTLRRMIAQVLIMGCVLGLPIALLFPAVQAAREAARRSQCVCNFCQITLAPHNYHSTYGVFPPAHVDDASGTPMHSWRVLLLPFMEQQALYNAYNFSEPWDSPNNRKLIAQMPSLFGCPSRQAALGPNGFTSYVLVTGPGTAFPDRKSVSLADIKDGTSSTIIATEVDNVDIPWTAPVDLNIRTMSLRVNDPDRPGISSRHGSGANVALADGSKRYLPARVTPEALKAMLTINGGESVDIDAALNGKSAQ